MIQRRRSLQQTLRCEALVLCISVVMFRNLPLPRASAQYSLTHLLLFFQGFEAESFEQWRLHFGKNYGDDLVSQCSPYIGLFSA